MPVVAFQNGDDPSAIGQMLTSPNGAQLGDLRLGARVRLWGEYDAPFQIAVGAYLWVPTGGRGAFVSTGQARGLPQVIMGGRAIERIVWSAALGARIQGDVTYAGVAQGPMFHWGAGAGVLLLDDRNLQLGAELSGDVLPRDVEKHSTNAELLVDVRYRFIHDLEVAGGVGPGLSAGIGTPDVRGVLSVAYTPEQPKKKSAEAESTKETERKEAP